MADVSEQLKNVRTMEDVVNLLMVLFTNLNNQNETYYDMFLNPTPMDIPLERYDENGELVTVYHPNVAKMRLSIYSGDSDPNGKQTAAQGSFYINTTNYDLFYKGYGNDSNGWFLLWSIRNLDYLSPTGNASRVTNLNMNSATMGTLAVERGGTGVNTITGMVRGNGTLPFTAAEDGIDYLGPASMVGIICFYPVYDSNLPNMGLPNGWLRCDGYNGYLKADYPRLSAKLGNKYGGTDITFGVPNILNRYIKGWDGTNVGDMIDGQVGKHLHQLSGSTAIEASHTHQGGSLNVDAWWTSTAYAPHGTGGIVNGYSASAAQMINTTTSWQAVQYYTFSTSGRWGGTTASGSAHSHALTGTTEYNAVGSTDKNEVDHILMVPIIKY